jgi:7-keto-8-aminopelargonate synthetase-like enzyme
MTTSPRFNRPLRNNNHNPQRRNISSHLAKYQNVDLSSQQMSLNLSPQHMQQLSLLTPNERAHQKHQQALNDMISITHIRPP